MALDPPSIASWPAGPIHWAFSAAARAAFETEALNALGIWIAAQSSLTLGEERTSTESRTIYFSLAPMVLPTIGIGMSPPPIHPEPIAGDVMLKDDLNWAVERASGRLLEILIHEVGHALGFDHATTTASIMHNPLTTPYTGALYAADITSVTSIYGSLYGSPGLGSTGITTVLNLIYDALRMIGVLTGPGRTPAPDASADGLRILNHLIGSWNARGTVVEHMEKTRWPLVAAQGAYNIGIDRTGYTTADWVAERPRRIDRVDLISTDGTLVLAELEIASRDRWANNFTPSTSGEPSQVYYDASHPFGVVNFYPVPDAAYYADVWAWKRLSRFTSINDPVILPDGYEEALTSYLAVRLAAAHQKPVPPAVAEIARQSLASISRYAPARPSSLDPALGGSGGLRFDSRTGNFYE